MEYRVDIETGKVRNKKGKELGSYDSLGYVRVSIAGRMTLRSHIVWYKATGVWPTYQIRHYNKNITDDRFPNLRASNLW